MCEGFWESRSWKFSSQERKIFSISLILYLCETVTGPLHDIYGSDHSVGHLKLVQYHMLIMSQNGI